MSFTLAGDRSTRWHCGEFELPLSHPLVMGVLNVTPDSFSDGGQFGDPGAAVRHAGRMLAEHADIIDVGGESTRPGAAPVSVEEELARVRPVVTRVATDLDVRIPVSVDTRHALVASESIAAGASIINDVGGFRDPEMLQVAKECDAGLVVMHMLGEPGTMQKNPRYKDVVTEVREYLLDRALTLEREGIARERICLDPGIGFGKMLEHNIALLRSIGELAAYGYPVLVGASRKRMIGELTGIEDPQARLGGSLAVAMWAARQGAAVLRVHDVGQTHQALAVTGALELTDRIAGVRVLDDGGDR